MKPGGERIVRDAFSIFDDVSRPNDCQQQDSTPSHADRQSNSRRHSYVRRKHHSPSHIFGCLHARHVVVVWRMVSGWETSRTTRVEGFDCLAQPSRPRDVLYLSRNCFSPVIRSLTDDERLSPNHTDTSSELKKLAGITRDLWRCFYAAWSVTQVRWYSKVCLALFMQEHA